MLNNVKLGGGKKVRNGQIKKLEMWNKEWVNREHWE